MAGAGKSGGSAPSKSASIGKGSSGVKSGGKSSKKKKKELAGGLPQYTMKIVESSTCIVCKSQCERGLRYMAKMAEPGAVGRGVPCILTKRRI